MNVKELLMSCNIQKTAALHFEMQEPPVCQDWDLFLQGHMSFIREIAPIEPVQTGYIILGSTYEDNKEAQHDLQMYDKAELLSVFTRCKFWEQDLQLEYMSEDELGKIRPQALQYVFPNCYDMETMPWEKLLGVELFEENVCAFGQDLMAAMLIQEMSFWGLSYEKSRAGQEQLWGRLQEALQEKEAYEENTCTMDELLVALAQDDTELELDGSDYGDVDARLSLGELSLVASVKACIAEYQGLLAFFARQFDNQQSR